MSNRAARRAKSPANRNKFSDIGITGRKTGVRVAGNVRVDEDGLENVEEFYKQTSPTMAKEMAPTKTSKPFHALLSPTPIRSMPEYGTLIGALDMPDIEANYKDIEDEVITTPMQARAIKAQVMNVASSEYARSPTRVAGRRATLMPQRREAMEPSWVNSPKKGRRVTMAFTAQRERMKESGELVRETEEVVEDDLNFGPAVDGNDGDVLEDEGDLVDYDPPVGASNGSHDIEDGAELDAGQENDEQGHEEPEIYTEDNADDHYNIEDPGTPPEDDLAEEQQEENNDEDQQQQQQGGLQDDLQDDDPMDEIGEAEEQAAPKHKPGRPAKHKNTDEQPLRRSTRTVVQPLAYWRNEHVEYEYESGPVEGVPVPKLKNVVRVRKTAEEKNQAKKRRVKRTLPSLRDIPRSELDLDDRGRFFYYDDENYGFPVKDDKKGMYGPKFTAKAKPRGSGKRTLDELDDNDDIPVDERPKVVLGPDGETEVVQEIAISRQSIHWTDAGTKNSRFKAGFGLMAEQENGEILASSGILSIAVGGHKPPRNCGPRTLIYLVTSGQVEVKIHSATFRVGILGQFLVPTNNTYSIANVGTHPAQLYYVHIGLPTPAAPVVEEAATDSAGNENSESEIE